MATGYEHWERDRDRAGRLVPRRRVLGRAGTAQPLRPLYGVALVEDDGEEEVEE